MSKSLYLENKFLNHLFGHSTFTAPSPIYVALLSSVNTGDDGATYTELYDGYGYTRQTVTMGLATDGYSRNTAEVDFGPSVTNAWSAINGVALFDSATHSGGNMLYWKSLSSPISPGLGTHVIIKTSDLRITED